MKRLHSHMRKDKDNVFWTERYWKTDPLTKTGRWTRKRVTGRYIGYDTDTKTHKIQTKDGVVQRNNFEYIKKNY